ncbi:hypothetical protein NP493_3991g00002 [Ridgeia piscesae]|uniref:G-protein coupled receptors family 1 profile domain-containing protein n=1 Tax=Ridgeia piscesae TaxID=27915 RepID=A0AAD9J3E8_RIDPI|nr:hypothetical protein NP493_3991g00002 [Ridgeia piscesae]
MLAVVVLLFGLCWLPLHVFILLIDFHPELIIYSTPEQEKFFIAIYYCVHWLAMSNSFVNPIVYGFLNESFRPPPVFLWAASPDVRMLGSSMGPVSNDRKLSCSTRMSDSSRKLLSVRLTSFGAREHSTGVAQEQLPPRAVSHRRTRACPVACLLIGVTPRHPKWTDDVIVTKRDVIELTPACWFRCDAIDFSQLTKLTVSFRQQ